MCEIACVHLCARASNIEWEGFIICSVSSNSSSNALPSSYNFSRRYLNEPVLFDIEYGRIRGRSLLDQLINFGAAAPAGARRSHGSVQEVTINRGLKKTPVLITSRR